MRRSVVALVFAFVAALGVFTPAAAAASAPRVVIIVGATHGATASYRARADQVYAEAIKYTPNVVKVYSPNATWSQVKAAVKGASIVVYFGHGNGWPSPYTYDSKYTTKDGFGLNATAGDGDANNKYYGEPYVASMDLAPNAVVLLGNLCYASGNSEPGDKAPSVSTARKRVDNYGAGFLKAARAVIADGHGSLVPYIRALFTTHATVEEVWRSAPNFHDHVASFPSSRTPGAVAFTDTDTATAGYYRSLVWKPGLTTDQVTGASYADTGVDPSSLVVPGNAEVGAAGASLYRLGRRAGRHARGRGPGPRPRERQRRWPRPGRPSIRVEGIDDPSVTGWVAPADLVPRDSKAPAIWAVDTAGGVFSPNGDERYDAASLSGRFSETVDWRVRILDGDAVLKEQTGHGIDLRGRLGRPRRWRRPPRRRVRVRHPRPGRVGQRADDRRPGTLTHRHGRSRTVGVSPDADTARWFSPNGDGSRDAIAWTASATERGTLVTRVYDADDQRVSTGAQSNSTGASTIDLGRRRRRRARRARRPVHGQGHATRRDRHQRRRPSSAAVRVDTTLGFVDVVDVGLLPAGRRQRWAAPRTSASS